MYTRKLQHIITFTGSAAVGDSRTFSVSNISLVITYTTVIVAALMLAGFLWMAFAYSGQGGSSGYGGRSFRKKRQAFQFDEGIHYIHFMYTLVCLINMQGGKWVKIE